MMRAKQMVEQFELFLARGGMKSSAKQLQVVSLLGKFGTQMERERGIKLTVNRCIKFVGAVLMTSNGDLNRLRTPRN